jgi:hypothetical protein
MVSSYLISGHEVSVEPWLACPVVAVPQLVDTSMSFDEATEALLTETFGFTFTTEHGDPEFFRDRDVVVRSLVSREGVSRWRPVAQRVVLAHDRAVFFDYDLAVVDARGDDPHARERFDEFGIGLCLRTSQVWSDDDGFWVKLRVNDHLLPDELRLELAGVLGPDFLVRLSPDGSVVARGGA